jgi:hypothetical protein
MQAASPSDQRSSPRSTWGKTPPSARRADPREIDPADNHGEVEATGKTELVLSQFISIFAGRTDAYVAWTGTQFVTVREPLTPQVVLLAFQTRRPVGAFFLAPGNCSHVLALDLDRPDGWELARRVGEWLWAQGVPAYVERSRGGRAHLWIVVGADVERNLAALPGIVLRSALRAVIAGAGIGDVAGIELRPGSDRLYGPAGLGHSLRLPTMPHKATGERHPLCDPQTGAPLGPTLGEMLLALRLAPADRVVELAEQYRPPLADRPAIGPTRRSGRGSGMIARFNESVGVCEVLTREFGIANAVPGRTIRCVGHDDRNPSLAIARDDARVWCHSPGCPLEAGGRGQDAYGLWLLAKTRTETA